MATQESSIGRYTMGEPEMNPSAVTDPARVLSLDEIGSLAASGGKPAETLMKVVELIANRFQTDVCSAYLLEPDRANLVLAATIGALLWWIRLCSGSREVVPP